MEAVPLSMGRSSRNEAPKVASASGYGDFRPISQRPSDVDGRPTVIHTPQREWSSSYVILLWRTEFNVLVYYCVRDFKLRRWRVAELVITRPTYQITHINGLTFVNTVRGYFPVVYNFLQFNAECCQTSDIYLELCNFKTKIAWTNSGVATKRYEHTHKKQLIQWSLCENIWKTTVGINALFKYCIQLRACFRTFLVWEWLQCCGTCRVSIHSVTIVYTGAEQFLLTGTELRAIQTHPLCKINVINETACPGV